MALPVAALVLLAGLMHASWNAILRLRGDRLVTMALLTGVSGLIALVGVFFVDVPARASWPWLATSVVLHLGYNLFLQTAYRYGDLGKVYPLARGTAPMLTLLASSLLLGEALSAQATAGVLLIGAGILILSFEHGLRAFREAPQGPVFALITSLFIAGYTMSDGVGARAAGTAPGYIMWLFLLDGLPLALLVLAIRKRQTAIAVRENWKAGIAAGALSMGAYCIAIWAMTVAPIPLVAALRETSVVFAVLIGTLFLGERLSAARIASMLVVAAGLIVLRL